MILENLSAESKVWLYKSDRELIDAEVAQIEEALARFIPSWSSHGNRLFGGGVVLENRFLVIAVDEAMSGASGCSIDTSVKFVKLVGNQLNINWFNRLKLILRQGSKTKEIQFSELSQYSDWELYNPMIQTVGELRNSWIVPVREFMEAQGIS